jgi:hypothetical protein
MTLGEDKAVFRRHDIPEQHPEDVQAPQVPPDMPHPRPMVHLEETAVHVNTVSHVA